MQKKQKHILITGSTGQLATEFLVLASKQSEYKFTFVDRKELDLAYDSSIEMCISKYNPDVVINCAAYTNVELAETEKELAKRINGLSLKTLSDCCNQIGAWLIHFSTDYVFNGLKNTAYSEKDEPLPINEYGASKLLGEQMITDHAHDYTILRVSWLYSTFGKNFYRTMIRLSGERSEIQVVNDQIACPTYARHLALDVLKMVELRFGKNQKTQGLFHFSQVGEASWYDFASEIIRLKEIDVLVTPVTSTEFPTKAVRPKYSKLDNSAFFQLTGLKAKSWQEGLKECVEHDMNP